MHLNQMLTHQQNLYPSQKCLFKERFLGFSSLVILTLSLSSCSSISPITKRLNPFTEKEIALRGVPKDATEYVCNDNKHFFVRMLNNNADAWLIYPDHEVNLSQSSSEKSTYTSGAIRLNLNADATTLHDGEKIEYSACKPKRMDVK